MSAEFISRIFGMFFFMIVSARIGSQNAEVFSQSVPEPVTSFIFALVGILFGLVVTPYLTVRPVTLARRTLNEISVDVLLVSILGLGIGLVLALLTAYPISLLGEPFGTLVPSLIAVVFGYLGMSIFGYRAREVEDFRATVKEAFTARATRPGHAGASEAPRAPRSFELPQPPEPNGNSVSVEDQAVRAAEAQHQHAMALAVYSKAVDIFRLGLGRAR